ncbi:MAG: gluconokinase [Clostridium sp.]|nr:gluconokinase [Clostridium sp.]
MRYLALDIGTTTIKGMVYDGEGKALSFAEGKTKSYSSEPDFMEKDAEESYKVILGVLRRLIQEVKKEKQTIGFISLSSYMHSLMAVDSDGEILSPLMMWNDGRSFKYALDYKHNVIGQKIYENTGTPIHAMTPLYKLMWIRDKEPEIFEKAHKFISMKEYLLYKMTNEFAIDHSMASATGMFDLKTLDWNELALSEIGIKKDRLSTPCPTTTIFNSMTIKFQEAIGADVPIPIVIGATDGCLASLGSHGTKKNTGVVTIGTSGAVRVISDTPLIDREARTFTYILDKEHYVSESATNNGGVVYEWMKELVGDSDDLDLSLSKSQPGAKGLIFLPYITGERAPYYNSKLRGSFLGLSIHHSKHDLMEAAIEGVSFALKEVYDILSSLVPEVDALYANGGFIKSEIWIKRLASILKKKIIISDQGDTALFGAYLLGLKAIGVINSYEESEPYFQGERVYEPEQSEVLDELFLIYQEAVSKNVLILEKLSSLQDNRL